MKHYYLVGIGGMGMSALAQVLAHEGIAVSGSDRDENAAFFGRLRRLGINIFPQNGMAVKRGIDKVIISKAVERSNPDLRAARRMGIPVVLRQDELRRIFRMHRGIAVAGTSGKTTVTGMIASIFKTAGCDISVAAGGMMKNYVSKNRIGNVHIGSLRQMCVETDESDGDMKGYRPDIAVLTNIGTDHFHPERLKGIYSEFADEVQGALVMNKDIPLKKDALTFGLSEGADVRAEDIRLYPGCSVFRIGGIRIKLRVPGMHNVYNALAAAGAGVAWGIPMEDIAAGLQRFKGIERRFDLLLCRGGIRVIDDYAHNPDKIRAALSTAHLAGGRVIAVYQPHGYGPVRMFLRQTAQAFADTMCGRDCLFITAIYYAGGTVKRDVSPYDLAEKIREGNSSLDIKCIEKREEAAAYIRRMAKAGDTIIVMGARDITLRGWAGGILL